MDETTSRHLRNASEVLLWIPIKNEFAHFDEQIVSYASRLSLFLQGVFELRRDSTERRGLDTAGPVERLQVVYNVQWTVVEEERRLLVAASFDRSWETYFRELADTTGSLLDAIFCHCEGFEKNTCADNFDAFMTWIRKYQRPCDFFFSAAPDLTTDDLRYLKQLSRVAEPGLLSADTIASRIALKPPGETAPHAQAENIEKALWSLFDLRKLFTPDVKLGAVAAQPQVAGDDKAAEAAEDKAAASRPPATVKQLKLAVEQADRAGNSRKQRSEQDVFDGAMGALFFNELQGLQEANERLELQLKRALEGRESLAVFARCTDLIALLRWSRSLAALEADRKTKLIAATQRAGVEILEVEELERIQGGILTEYPTTTHGVMALIQCDTRESFREFLEYMREKITSEYARLTFVPEDKPEKIWVNLGLTYHGLERLGLPESVLLQFPKEFREGMEARAGLLGDIGDPDYPLETGPVVKGREGSPRIRMSIVDAVVLLQANRSDLGSDTLEWWDVKNPFRTELAKLAKETGARVVSEQPLQRQFEGDSSREHFGFKEGGRPGSQPVPRVVYSDKRYPGPAYESAALRDSIRLGEILLGYTNQRGEPARAVNIALDNGLERELLKHGSFVVVRKLRQNVGVFRDFVASTANRLGIEPLKFKGLMMGRMPNGESLIPCAANAPNDFHFDDDPHGAQCPHYAHIRRANPRSRGEATVVPRILRRGFSYGERCPERDDPTQAVAEEEKDRGLVFMAYNANIAEQFEVIQRWINGGNRTGLLSTQQDLLAGQGPISQSAYWHRAGSAGGDKQFGPPAKPTVSLQWGAYLFVPSITALETLQLEIQRDVSAAVERGEEIIRKLLAFECAQAQLPAADELAKEAQRPHVGAPEAQGGVAPQPLEGEELEGQPKLPAERAVWKKVLEEAGGTDASDVWQAVRSKHNGVLRTAYGVLVANLDLAQRVLSDDGKLYSVSEYGERLGSLIGGHHLGIDRYDPDYAALAKDPNEYVNRKIDPSKAFEAARDYALAALKDAPSNFGRQETRVRRLAEIVVLELCHQWFGLPKEERRLTPVVFTSRYSFQVAPGHWLKDKILKQAEIIAEALESSLLGEHLSKKVYAPKVKNARQDANLVALASNGAMVGFAAPAIASIVTIVDTWSADGTLWRLSELVRSKNPPTYKVAMEILLSPTLEALGRKPVPSLLYRVAVNTGPIALKHGFEIKAGETVIVGLGAVYEDAREKSAANPEQWLFGGEYVEATAAPAPEIGTSHGCPARNAALAVFVGALSAVLSQENLRLERRFVVSYTSP
jgi:deferrochelatase/peroxidase EfeB